MNTQALREEHIPAALADTQEEVKMKKSVLFGTLAAAVVAGGVAGAATLDDVKARGKINCGVTEGTLGFSFA